MQAEILRCVSKTASSREIESSLSGKRNVARVSEGFSDCKIYLFVHLAKVRTHHSETLSAQS